MHVSSFQQLLPPTWNDLPASLFVLLKGFLTDYELGHPRRKAYLRILFKSKGKMEKTFFSGPHRNNFQAVAQKNIREPCHFASREDRKGLAKHGF